MANAAIGRALGLIVKNIGGARKAVEDMGVIGNPGKYSLVIGEDEEASPWEPLSVERGFQKEDSTVTVFFPNSSFRRSRVEPMHRGFWIRWQASVPAPCPASCSSLPGPMSWRAKDGRNRSQGVLSGARHAGQYEHYCLALTKSSEGPNRRSHDSGSRRAGLVHRPAQKRGTRFFRMPWSARRSSCPRTGTSWWQSTRISSRSTNGIQNREPRVSRTWFVKLVVPCLH